MMLEKVGDLRLLSFSSCPARGSTDVIDIAVQDDPAALCTVMTCDWSAENVRTPGTTGLEKVKQQMDHAETACFDITTFHHPEFSSHPRRKKAGVSTDDAISRLSMRLRRNCSTKYSTQSTLATGQCTEKGNPPSAALYVFAMMQFYNSRLITLCLTKSGKPCEKVTSTLRRFW